ncbi:MAG: hypothetical protein M4579_002571 [Chaenotheca gracillima]|nr:MAG: hypothetical protein M4579_002571 [Chaenotheca gracillima]
MSHPQHVGVTPAPTRVQREREIVPQEVSETLPPNINNVSPDPRRTGTHPLQSTAETQMGLPKDRRGKRSYETRVSSEALPRANNNSLVPAEDLEPSPKRTRSAQWPLQDSSIENETPPAARTAWYSKQSTPVAESTRSPGKDRRRRHESRTKPQSRPSKFVEGSMNDKTSALPPDTFTEGGYEHATAMVEEAARSRFDDDASAPSLTRFSKSTLHLPISSVGSISDRPSGHQSYQSSSSRVIDRTQNPPGEVEPMTGGNGGGVFRFGKSLAAVFNPMKLWNGWKHNSSGDDSRASSSPEKDPPEHSSRRRLRQRPQLAHDGIMTERKTKAEKVYAEMKINGDFYKGKGAITSTPTGVGIVGSSNERVPSQRDSGIDLDEQDPRASSGSIPTVLEKQYEVEGGKSVAQTTDNLVALSKIPEDNRTTTEPKGVKKAKSEMQLGETSGMVLRKQPSRRELQKQNRLSKKVSDLETKLMSARRELSQIMGEAVPPVPMLVQGDEVPSSHRKPFVPGALASLPSERLLFGTESNVLQENLHADKDVEVTGTRKKKGRRAETSVVRDDEKPLKAPAAPSLAKRTSGFLRKRKSMVSGLTDGPLGLSTVQSSLAKPETSSSDKNEEARKAQKTSENDSPRSTLPNKTEETNSLVEPLDPSSPLDPVPNPTQPRSDKARFDARSVSHDDRTTPSFLGRPCSASPHRRARSGPRYPTSPPPPRNLRSSVVPRLSKANTSANDDVFRPTASGQTLSNNAPNSIPSGDSEGGFTVPPVPKMPGGFEKIVRLASGDVSPSIAANVDPEKKLRQPKLRDAVTEDFEWPDDVF